MMDTEFRKKTLAIMLNSCFMTPTIAIILAILIAPTATAASGCSDVPATNQWDTSDAVATHVVSNDVWWNWGGPETSSSTQDFLKQDFSIEVDVLNDSASAVSFKLSTGYSYTFCAQFTPNPDNPPELGTSGDIYLLSSQNWGTYNNDFTMRMEQFSEFQDLLNVPVEWRDTIMWLPYRDVHAYENREATQFSVAVDSYGSVFKNSWFDPDPTFYIVFDNWDNSRHTDESAAAGDMIVELLVDVEPRLTLPKFTAYILIGILPLSCLVAPLMLHQRYHAWGVQSEAEEDENLVPILEDGSNPSQIEDD